jgi:hypothetical protein
VFTNEPLSDVDKFTGIAFGFADLGALAKGMEGLGSICSFSPDTPVATEDGEKHIGDLQIGD